MVSLIMSIGGNSLTKEFYDFAKNGGKEATPSAFGHQRDKISDEAFAYLLYEFKTSVAIQHFLQVDTVSFHWTKSDAIIIKPS